MSKFKPYQHYRPSNIFRLGDIPAQWQEKGLGIVCQLNPGKSEVSGLPKDLEVGFIPMELLGEKGELDVDEVRCLDDVYQGFTYCRDGDVIMAKITPCFENGKGALCLGLKNGIGMGTTELHVLRPKEINGKFLYWITRQNAFRKIGATELRGSAGQQRVPIEFVKNWVVALPSDEEQKFIVAFLDHTTAQLDDLIAQKQRLIELLKEKRQALITQAVTKGLNPKAKMKDSGVPWLGQIPEHWEKFKLGHLFDVMGSGTTPARERLDYYDGNTPWVTTSELRETEITKTNERVTDLALEDFPSLKIYPADSVVVAMYGATIGRLGILRVPATVNQACFVMGQSRLANFKFIYYFLWAIRNHLINLGYGGGQPNLNQEQIRNVRLALPSLKEQEGIVARLDQSVSELDSLTHQTELSVEKLSEYRQSLISAAVTGKIDLRDWKTA